MMMSDSSIAEWIEGTVGVPAPPTPVYEDPVEEEEVVVSDGSATYTAETIGKIYSYISSDAVHPFLTTDFTQYSVTEGLLLTFLLLLFIRLCISILRKGFTWLT